MTTTVAQQVKSEVATFQKIWRQLTTELSSVIVGHQHVIEGVLVALFADGHVLLEGVPGLGKTLLVKSLAQALNFEFKRIQCTPDLMPADILGTQLVVESDGSKRFEFMRGPVFTQLLLADEINRATPKTQAALLEAMEERQVTIAGTTYPLSYPFVVLATQNPIEMEGTYPLPEAQLDRFCVKLLVERPALEDLVHIVQRTTTAEVAQIHPIWSSSEAKTLLPRLRRLVREVMVASPIEQYVAHLVLATHPNGPDGHTAADRYVRYGASPRGAQAILLGAKVLALVDGRVNIAFEDVDRMVVPALNHRLVLNFEAEAERMTSSQVLATLRQLVKRPEHATVR